MQHQGQPADVLTTLWIQPRPCRSTLRGNQGTLEIAAEGGADRRSAKSADRPLNQSREAHPLGLAAPLPRRGASRPRLLRPTGPTRGR
jgi:hypothetical protein